MRRNQKLLAFGMALGGLLTGQGQAMAQSPIAQSLQTVQTQIGAVQTQGQPVDSSAQSALRLDARDRAEAQLWSLSDDEMERVKYLRLGPRGSFSVAGISPLEILGIHARNDAERQKYAEQFARVMYADTQRVLAFQRAYDVEIGKLTAGHPMIDYRGLPKVNASAPAADMVGVPRSQLVGGGQP